MPKTADAEHVCIAWLRNVFRSTPYGDMPITRTRSEFKDGWIHGITVARTGSGGQLSVTGLNWEWEVGISCWANRRGKSDRTKRQADWEKCGQLVDVINDSLAQIDHPANPDDNLLSIGEYFPIGTEDTDFKDMPYLVFVRATGPPRRRPGDSRNNARIDLEVVLTMGRDAQ